MTSVACPTSAEWEAFVVGDLTGSVLERMAGHLAACTGCKALLTALDGYEDGLVGQLRGMEAAAPADGEDVPDALISAARAAYRGAETGEVVADPGKKLDGALVAGPQRLGRFLLLERLGVGSFGYVFRAHDTELDRDVAIKVQRAGLPGSSEERDRFLREARSAAQLGHPGIVSLYETGETEEGVCYLVTELIDGDTMEERARERPFGVEEAARLVQRIAEALGYAHEHGIIHRDIKPSNVMLDRTGEPHLMDFGLAKREAGESTMTPEGVTMGTPAYMSPEMARGESHEVDARSDVFSLGVVLYELLTGERPFQGNRRMLILQVLEDDPRPPHRLNDKIPRDLETICLKAMSKAPARRYADAGGLADDIARFLRGEPIVARSLGVAGRLRRWCRRNPVAAGLFIAISLGSVFGFLHLSRLSEELVQRSAIESAAQYSEMLEVVNDLYSSEIVRRMGDHGVRATADYARAEKAIPLPATLLTELLERISRSETGMRGRHYSEYPFRTRTNGGPQTEFEWDALRHLNANPDEPYTKIVDDYEGRPALLYATARKMLPSCVACHNKHPDSTKDDWKEGDVRGVLKIIRPLEHDIQATRAGLRSSFVLVGAVAVVSLVLTSYVLVQGSRRKRGRAGLWGGPKA